MKAAPLLVSWHEDNSPIYSAHFEPHGKGRLATAGGDGHIRIWKVETNGEERKVTYLSTLKKHTQAVNVVRWCPRGELLASAGDDGNVLLWTPSETAPVTFGDDNQQEDVEHWRVKTMCRSNTGSEIYDLAWSPDGLFFVTGSMDNVARIYNASNGQTVRQIAEHNHYVQGVAWDPLNEYVATQSSDRSVHIYSLKTKDGQFALTQHNKVVKMDLPVGRRISSNSPAPPDFGHHRASLHAELSSEAVGSPRPSAPGTPQSLALPMNPPPTSHSRRSSIGSQMGQSMRRSVSPSPSTMPLPAVMPSASPSLSGSLGFRNSNIYANETLTSFFRRLTFAPDGSLLFTPAGQYRTFHPATEGSKGSDDIINTVYIYTRAGLNKPPVAYLPGHKKPSVAVKCSPVYYHLRVSNVETKEITIDTRTEDDIPPLPEPAVPPRPATSFSAMDPPPLTSAPSPSLSVATMASPRPPLDPEHSPSTPAPPAGPPPAFALPYRMVYAVATQDAVHVYDTQQQRPLCIVSNLHYATFTDLSWSSDGQTLLMTSSDGFCSALTFSPGELGLVYHHSSAKSEKHTPAPISVGNANSASSTPQATPTTSSAAVGSVPPPPVPAAARRISGSNSTLPPNPSPSPYLSTARPASPARSMSASSIATEASFARAPDQNAPPVMNNPTPALTSLPSVAATGSNSSAGGMPLFTPPQTPGHHASGSTSSLPGVSVTGTQRESSVSDTNVPAVASAAGVKREGTSPPAAAQEGENGGREKRRRIAPTPVTKENAGNGGGG
ncbi:WD40-repeat-containing domain protein [Neohortaea acidophila]|uniref:WD40-repeat-containing domain protein n=1 Tax=Neohortaea acidophila TaxID=245834 RepID=A0A6A6Q3F3_9PEZI|nr:WD40-repeat-containing domain protein [Neohortaea acidophila]KAF2486549.1 WD40-repeat-containing domain protein [Neohortaea acidophila]